MLIISKNPEVKAILVNKFELIVGQKIRFSYYGAVRVGVVTKLTTEYFQVDRFVDGRFYFDLITSQTRDHAGIEILK
jgi:hypothetical protein